MDRHNINYGGVVLFSPNANFGNQSLTIYSNELELLADVASRTDMLALIGLMVGRTAEIAQNQILADRLRDLHQEVTTHRVAMKLTT